MTSIRILQISLSFVVAGLWVGAATLAGERLGSRMAGLITNLPSTILVTTIFMAITRGPAYAAAAAASATVGMALCMLFIVAFIVAVPRGLGWALGVSFGAWLLAAWLVNLLPPPSLALGVLAFLLVNALAALVLERLLTIPPAPQQPRTLSAALLGWRALFAGGVVAGAVTAAQVAPPSLAGILSCFPAMYSSSLVILARSQGPGFARASGKAMVFTASSIIVYAAAVAAFYPRLGTALGTVLGYGLAAVYLALLAPVVRRWA